MKGRKGKGREERRRGREGIREDKRRQGKRRVENRRVEKGWEGESLVWFSEIGCDGIGWDRIGCLREEDRERK